MSGAALLAVAALFLAGQGGVMAGGLSLHGSLEVERPWYCGSNDSERWLQHYFSKKVVPYDDSCGRLSYGVFGEYSDEGMAYADAVSLGLEVGYNSGAAWGTAGVFGDSGSKYGAQQRNGSASNGSNGENSLYYGLKFGASFLNGGLRPYLRGGFHAPDTALGLNGTGSDRLDLGDRLLDNTFYGLGIEYRGTERFIVSGGWDRLVWGDDFHDNSAAGKLYSDYYGLNIIYNYLQ